MGQNDDNLKEQLDKLKKGIEESWSSLGMARSVAEEHVEKTNEKMYIKGKGLEKVAFCEIIDSLLELIELTAIYYSHE